MRILAKIIMSFVLVSGCAAISNDYSPSERGWRLAFANNADGETLDGSKEALIAAVQNGRPVRIVTIDRRVDHAMDAGFLTVFEGEVFAQINPIESQRPQTDPLGVYFREPGVKWRAIIGTNGLFTAFMDERDPNVRTSAARWFVED